MQFCLEHCLEDGKAIYIMVSTVQNEVEERYEKT